MAQQAYTLLRIIIIDSFWQGQVNELSLTGHTQLEGTNGAGKTSLMRLLPLFYGMRPSDIVSKVDQARNFADYYLPRDSSMLVYEYQRPHGQTCMVLASSDGRGVHFKFIDGAYDSQYFIADDGKTYSIAEVDRLYRSIGCDRSSFLGIDKYRQVIQNLRSGRKLKDVRLLQNRYAFSDLPCPHIDKVINGTIEKNLDFEAVKKMLVAIASDHLARNVIEEKENISLNKDEISNWLADIQASRAIQKVAEKITIWQSDFTSLDSLLEKLQHLHFEIIEHQARLEAKQLERAETKTSSRNQQTALESELEQSTTKLNKQLADIKAQMDADQSSIDLLDNDKLDFDEDDAPSYQLQADKAPRIQQELNEVNAIIEAFEGSINKIRQKFEKLIQDHKVANITNIASNNNQTASIKENASIKLSQISDVYQSQRNDLNEQLNQQNLSLRMQQQNIDNNLSLAQKQLQQPLLDTELLADIDTNQQGLNQAQEKQNQLYQVQAQIQQALNTVEKQRDNQLANHQQENRYLEQLRKDYAEVETQLIPETGSLHHYLTNEPLASQWKENIGRLLSSEQLSRRDLDPQWLGGELNLYGLSLDLQQLSGNDSLFLDETQLREKRDSIDIKRLAQSDKIAQLDNHIAQLSKQIADCNVQKSQGEQTLKQNELNRDQLKVQQENLAVKKHLAIKAHREAINAQLKSLELDKKSLAKKHSAFDEAKQEQLGELNNQMLEKRMVVESDRDSQLSLLEDELKELTEKSKQHLKELKKQQNTDLHKLDPDGEVDKRTQELKVLEQRLHRCAEFEQKARKYQHFINERYCQRDALVEQNQNRSIEKRNISLQLEDIQVNLSNEITKLKQLIKKLNLEKQVTEDLLVQLNNSRHFCEMSGINVVFSEQQPNNQADLTVSFCNDWSVQFKAIEKRLSSQLERFNERFRKDHSSSELFENWQKLVNENDKFDGAKRLFKYRDPIADLLSSAEQKQKSTYQLVSVNAEMINEFYAHIEHFAKTIKNIGKKLSNNVTALAHFEALADINVTTVMKQEELDYWGPLYKNLLKYYELYKDQLRDGLGDVPDDLVYCYAKTGLSYLPNEGFVP